ncbi:hypothetical protein D770_14665 [Flammeovirgaceae bacterium 311]|nr:hypothetical protein D770_14665 [Flammeovirgaceae bacterium 311]
MELLRGFRQRPSARVFFNLRYNYNSTDMGELDLLFLGDNSTRDHNHVAMLTFSYALFLCE